MKGFGESMSISSRIHDTIEGWQAEWKDRLRGWMASWAMESSIRLFDFFEPELREEIRPSFQRLLEIEGLPDDLRNVLTKAIEAPGAIQFAIILPYLVGGIFGLAMGSIAPTSRIGSYQIDKLIKSFRFDPGSIITAWRRDPATYEKLFDDLKDQGWHEDRIEALKFLTLYMPSAAEIVHWYAREVYEPDMIERYGLDSELPTYEETDFPKIGVDPVQAKHHWMAHWEHASYMQIREMLHRGVLSKAKEMPAPPTTKTGWTARDAEGEEAAYDWYRLVEIPPFWRARLTEMMFEVPTRVDVRRWWDMRTISEERLYSIYHSRGYHGKDLDDYVLWTKVYTAWPDLIARFKNGWITEDDVRSELITLGMPPERVEEMIQTKVKTAAPERVAPERTATATEIMKGVKKGVITSEEGIERLMRMGYSREEAEFKLEVYLGVAEGSPESYMEFVALTEAYRKAMGLSYEMPPPELLEAEKALKEAEAELKAKIAEGIKEDKLFPYLKAKDDAGYRYRQMLILWQEEKRKEGGL